MSIPNHIAIIMDGNGRWAKKKNLPRVSGHVVGVKKAKEIIDSCCDNQVKYLTLFAFGRENWRRPEEEVSFLMNLLYEQLSYEFKKLHKKKINVRFIGDRSRIDSKIKDKIDKIELLTKENSKLYLSIALDYSGSFDIIQAVNKIKQEKNDIIVNEEIFAKYLLTYPYPNPDLFIRTSGEFRLSNFMLWQLSYSECYFTDILWPDFDTSQLLLAIKWYQSRERRFGKISEQIEKD